MGIVITIYNHGTNDDDLCKESIVTMLHVETKKGQSEILVQGVGSKLYRGGDHFVIVTQGVGSKLHGSGVKGSAVGEGVETNVGPVVECIEKLVSTEKIAIDCINMCGWSRGGVTCFKQANALAKCPNLLVSTIPIRIFAIDPVPGCAGEANAHMYKHLKILHNVMECQIIIAESERRNTFRAVFPPNFLVKPECKWDSMPGTHSQVAKVNPGESAGVIVKNWAKEFLKESETMGSLRNRILTPFDDGRLMEPGACLSLYAKMMMDEYEGMMSKGRELTVKGLIEDARYVQQKTVSNKALAQGGKPLIKSTHEKYHGSGTQMLLTIPQIGAPCRVFTNRHHSDLFGQKYPGYVAVMNRVQQGSMILGDYNLLAKFHDHDGSKQLLFTDWKVVKQWFYLQVLKKVGMGTAVDEKRILGNAVVIDDYHGSNIDRY